MFEIRSKAALILSIIIASILSGCGSESSPPAAVNPTPNITTTSATENKTTAGTVLTTMTSKSPTTVENDDEANKTPIVLTTAAAGNLASPTGTLEVLSNAPTTKPGECPKVGSASPLPKNFPQSFPLPPGTVLTSSQDRGNNRLVFDGLIPLDLDKSKEFFDQQLTKAGFKQNAADSESGEAESAYEGSGISGRWLIRGNSACPGVTTLSLLVQK